MKATADVTSGKPIAVRLQSIAAVSAIYHLVAFYDIHGRKEELDGPAVSALGVRSRKLSNVLSGQS
jgi:hypothetical protein